MNANDRIFDPTDPGQTNPARRPEIDPVCKFGPGGDFVRFWPGTDAPVCPASAGKLTKLLYKLARLIATSPHSAQPRFTTVPLIKTHGRDLHIFRAKEEFENAIKNKNNRN